MGRRKERRISIREDRLSKIDVTKMEVAVWLLAKKKVEDRTSRIQPAPPRADAAEPTPDSEVDAAGRSDVREAL